jgi:hypothetical protein
MAKDPKIQNDVESPQPSSLAITRHATPAIKMPSNHEISQGGALVS